MYRCIPRIVVVVVVVVVKAFTELHTFCTTQPPHPHHLPKKQASKLRQQYLLCNKLPNGTSGAEDGDKAHNFLHNVGLFHEWDIYRFHSRYEAPDL